MNTEACHKHREELLKNEQAWKAKKSLRVIYKQFYQQMSEHLSRHSTEPKTLEFGSGIGAIKEVIPSCMTSELFPVAGIDRVENIYSINFDDDTLDNILLFDVFHHLEYPGEALAEFHRVLRSEGRVIICDPDMSLCGQIVYGLFHPEPLGMKLAIQLDTNSKENRENPRYYAAQANAWRIFVKKQNIEQIKKNWNVVATCHYVSFAYWGTGGFSKKQWYPDACLGLIQKIDNLLQFAPQVFSARLLVVLEVKK